MLQGSLEKAHELISTGMSWGWDARFHTALMVIQPDNADAVMADLGRAFDAQWKVDTVDEAPEMVNHLVKYLSGMREGQTLFTKTFEEEKCVMFAACWPWVGRSHLSVRLGVFKPYGSPDENTQVTQLLRSIFAPDS